MTIKKTVAAQGKQAQHAFLAAFKDKYREVHGKPLLINTYKESWAVKDLFEMVGQDRAFELLDYYFRTNANHSFRHFMYNIEVLEANLQEEEKDRRHREELRRRTKEMMEQSEQ